MFAPRSFHPLRWQRSVLQRLPDARAEPSYCRVVVDVEWIATPAGYTSGYQAGIDSPAIAHGSSNNLLREHTRLASE
jgi:hypothetical protein